MQDEIFKAFDLMDKGDNVAALELLDQLSTQIEPTDEAYFSYVNTRGYVLAGLERYDEARVLYGQLLEAAQVREDWEQVHMTHHQLAMVERMAGQFRAALDLIIQEKTLLDQYFPDDPLRHSVNAYEYGYLYFLLGDKEQARVWLDQSLALVLQTDDLIAQACAYRGLGKVTGDKTYLDQAYRLFKEAGEEQGAEEVKGMMET